MSLPLEKSSYEAVTRRSQFGPYIFYQDANRKDGVLFDPITLESVFLSPDESLLLAASSDGKIDVTLLSKLAPLGFTFSARDELPVVLLNRQLVVHRIKGQAEKVVGLRILLTDKCNMACAYCFVKTNSGAKDMTPQELFAGLDYLVAQNKGANEISVQWFGGEPLIRFDLMKIGDRYVAEKATEAGIDRVRFSVVTNGTILSDEMLDHFEANQYSVGVSIDGMTNINQVYRFKLNGAPADEAILRNIARLTARKEIETGAVLTATSENIPNLPETVEYFVKQLQLKVISINHPIPNKDGWFVEGTQLANQLFKARIKASALGARLYSVLDKIYQCLDRRRPDVYEHIKSGNGIIAALMPRGKISVSSINFTEQKFIHPIEILNETPELLSTYHKDLLSSQRCQSCPAMSVCGGPTPNDILTTGSNVPIVDHCNFYERSLELVLWDDTGLQ